MERPTLTDGSATGNPSPDCLPAAVVGYLDHCYAVGDRLPTIAVQRRRLEALHRAGLDLVTATPGELRALEDERGHKPGTRRGYFVACRRLHTWLHAQGLIERNVWADVRPPRVSPPRAHPLSEQEVAAIFATIPTMGADSPASLRYRLTPPHVLEAWFVLGIEAGLRLHEIQGVDCRDLEQTDDGPVLWVNGKGGSRLAVPASANVVRVLERFDGQPFTGYSLGAVGKAITKVMRKAGIEKGGPHRLRHTFGTRVYRYGGHDLLLAKEALRHSSITSTMHYVQGSSARLHSVVRAGGGGA